jgi:hypothetical protein
MFFPQEEFEFLGVIKLQDESYISYKVVFNEDNGFLKGFTLTDIGGTHETKSYLAGYFDEKLNTLDFYESGIIYTKSFVNENDFCFVNFEGKLKKLNQNQQIDGTFKGLYSDGKECISGEISLKGLGKILKRAKKIDRKVDKSILISKEKKDKVHLLRDIDSINTNRLNKDETLSIFTKYKKVKLIIYDAGQEDGDKISIVVNGKVLFKSLEAFSKKKTIEIPLNKSKTEIEITALNTGVIGGNTIIIQIKDMENTIETVTNLKKGEKANFVVLIKK